MRGQVSTKDGDVTLYRALGLLSALAFATVWSTAPRAEVATDGTLGRRVRLSGPDIEVGAEFGRVAGRNLFHSFERFGVEPGGRVTFTGPSGLDNVVSRVTGGEASRIDGTLRSRVPGADVWLVNPAGVVFGSGARLDVPGSFHASTADEVRFPDGAVFSALDPGGSTLSVAPPEAFGFLGAGSGELTAEAGSVLAVGTGKALSLVAGRIALFGAPIAQIQAPEGSVALVALGGGPGIVGVGRSAEEVDVSGQVVVANGATIDVSGDGGGSVLIQGGQLFVANSSRILANNTGDKDLRGGIAIQAGSVLVGFDSEIASDASAGSSGDAGGVSIDAGSLTQGPRSTVSSSTFGSGNAGDIRIRVGSLSLGGEGPDLSARITSASEGATSGSAGDIAVVADEIQFRGVASVDSTTFGSGDGGTIQVSTRVLSIDGAGAGVDDLAGISSQTNRGSSGDGGRVSVNAREVELRNGGAISSNTGGSGRAGPVAIEVGRLLIDSGTAADRFFGGVQSRVGEEASGGGGTVLVRADDIELRNGGAISTSTLGAGDAGEVTVRAGRVLIDADGATFTEVASGAQDTSSGNAGSVTVTAHDLELRDGGAIQSDNMATGRAGSVSVTAGRLRIADGGQIGSSAAGAEPAGDVTVRAGRLEVDRGGIRTEGSGAEGGRIDVAADEAILLRDADVSSNGILPGKRTSLIGLEAPLIVLDGSRVTSLTEGRPIGGSGEASLLGDVTVVSADSLVAASSSIVTTGLQTELGSGLRLPASSFLSAESLLGESCAARQVGRESSFTRAGRKGGLPPSPDRPLASTRGKERLRLGDALRMTSDCHVARAD